MSPQDNDAHTQFGIDEIYFHAGFAPHLLEKLQQRAMLSLDAEDTIVLKNVSCDMILIFHKQVSSHTRIYGFLKFLRQYANKEAFIEANTLLNEEELFAAIKSKNFVLVTPRMLAHGTHRPDKH